MYKNELKYRKSSFYLKNAKLKLNFYEYYDII